MAFGVDEPPFAVLLFGVEEAGGVGGGVGVAVVFAVAEVGGGFEVFGFVGEFLCELVGGVDFAGPVAECPLSPVVGEGSAVGAGVEEDGAFVGGGDVDVADVEGGVVDGVFHLEFEGFDVGEFSPRAPDGHPEGFGAAVGGGGEVVAHDRAGEVFEGDAGADPRALTDGLEFDAAVAVGGVDPEADALRRGGAHFEDEVGGGGPVGGEV